ncbi:MAG: hypothetical protein KF878_20270 [Planctomycetes bacterium]|nr:hypothetical protein [Planctomycetota bacterium]
MAVVVALALAPTARGQVSVEPAALDEGRPATVRVTWVHEGADPALVRRLVIAWPGGERVVEAARDERVVWVDDDALALTLEVPDRPGVEGRAPRPPVVARLEGEAAVVFRQVAPGESLIAAVELVPLRDVELTVTVELHPLRPDALPAGARLRVPGPALTWRRAPQIITPADEGRTPDRGAPAHARRPGRPRPASRRRRGPGARAAVALGPAPEPLAIQYSCGRRRPPSTRRPRPPAPADAPATAAGLGAAAERAGLASVERAVRLPDDRWVLQAGGRLAVVGPHGGPDGPARAFDGQAFPLALALARDGRAPLGRPDPQVARALEAAGLGDAREVTLATLVPLLEALAAHGAALAGDRIGPGR